MSSLQKNIATLIYSVDFFVVIIVNDVVVGFWLLGTRLQFVGTWRLHTCRNRLGLGSSVGTWISLQGIERAAHETEKNSKSNCLFVDSFLFFFNLKLPSKLVNEFGFWQVNHFPGSGYITNKVNLATSGLPHVPIAFKIPDQKAQLINYASSYFLSIDR